MRLRGHWSICGLGVLCGILLTLGCEADAATPEPPYPAKDRTVWVWADTITEVPLSWERYWRQNDRKESAVELKGYLRGKGVTAYDIQAAPYPQDAPCASPKEECKNADLIFALIDSDQLAEAEKLGFQLAGASVASEDFGDDVEWSYEVHTSGGWGHGEGASVKHTIHRTDGGTYSSIDLECSKSFSRTQMQLIVRDMLLFEEKTTLVRLLKNSDLFQNLGEGVDSTPVDGGVSYMMARSGNKESKATTSGNPQFSQGPRAELAGFLWEVCGRAIDVAKSAK